MVNGKNEAMRTLSLGTKSIHVSGTLTQSKGDLGGLAACTCWLGGKGVSRNKRGWEEEKKPFAWHLRERKTAGKTFLAAWKGMEITTEKGSLSRTRTRKERPL